jgi:Sulfotransferase domain
VRVVKSMFSHTALPVLATVPRSGTWFLRYAISFLCHLDRGGRIDDRLIGRTIGDRTGSPFDFEHFRGGPLFRVQGTLPTEHLFIGHTVCPGFADLSASIDWWHRTPFHVPGYDYLHEPMNFRYTPVDLAAYEYTRVRVAALERAARKADGPPMVLVYRNPLDQAASYFRYSQDHKSPLYNSLGGRPLRSVPFRQYLFDCALPSYAKQFISFQTLARRHPTRILLLTYERLERDPVGMIAAILDHLTGAAQPWPHLADAVWLARREHMKAIERELGRSLDGTRPAHASHITQMKAGPPGGRFNAKMLNETLIALAGYGIDSDLFDWPVTDLGVNAA